MPPNYTLDRSHDAPVMQLAVQPARQGLCGGQLRR